MYALVQTDGTTLVFNSMRELLDYVAEIRKA